jgi:glycosyltransferase involved in cell wall biosynthesis
VIELISTLPQAEFFIFWTGSLEIQLLPLTQQANVHYFGRQPLEKIQSYLPNIDYCLMPSECLESFWLSALNALSRGIPVIGYKKGWVEPFILPEYNLFAYKGTTTAERILHSIEKLTVSHNSPPPNFQQTIQHLLAQYTPEIRYQQFLKLCGDKIPHKIVLVSDFINKFGGIETYLHDAKSLLEAHGHHVLLRGGKMPKGTLGRIKMWRGLITTPFNFWSARKFNRFLKKEQPDLVRFHSLLRNLWPNVVRVAKKRNIKSWMMYHDFWYFYPFPRKLFSVDEIKTPLTLHHFMASTKKEKRIRKLATKCKYFRMQGLVQTLKKLIDLHLVPSHFMEKILQESYGVPQGKVKTLQHFLQK